MTVRLRTPEQALLLSSGSLHSTSAVTQTARLSRDLTEIPCERSTLVESLDVASPVPESGPRREQVLVLNRSD